VIQMSQRSIDFELIAREALSVAGTSRSVKASLAIERAGRALLEAAHELRKHESGKVALLIGRAHEDRQTDETAWVVAAFKDAASAKAEADRLNDLAGKAGQSVGKADLVGLTQGEQAVIKEALGANDHQARVGRHGVSWSVEIRELA